MSNITLARPAAGQRTSILPTPSASISLDFDPTQATLDRIGNDLNFTFDDGASISITGFYSDYTKDNVPDFEVDGSLVAGKDFFSAFAPDLMPAAGPSAAAERSSRYTEHDDSSLQAGLNHLDGLDYTTGNSTSQSVPLFMSGVAASYGYSSGSADSDSSGDEIKPDVYHTRLIVTATSQNSFSFFAMNQNGVIINDPSQIGIVQETNLYFTVQGIGPDGKITVELTAAGLAALNNGTLASDMLLITIDGVEYKMPLVISGGTAGQSYDAATEEARAQLDGPLKAEWYASDSRTVSGESVTLGGTNYNQVDIDRSDAGGAGNIGVWDSDIDITASAKGVVNITAEHNTGNAHGLATYGTSGQVSSSVRGGDESSIHIVAKATGSAGTARAVYTNSNEGAAAATTVEGGDISIEAHGNEAGAHGVYAWAAGGREAATTIKANNNLTITADSSKGGSSGSGNAAVHATGSGAKIVISSGPDGKLQVDSHLDNSTQENFNVEKGGSFAASGISAYNGGQVLATGSDINISSDVSDSSAHGTTTAVYAGYGNAKTTINGYDDRDNHIEFSASAPDHAMAVIGTNSGTVAINGGSGDDTIKISSDAKFGSSFGIAAQAGGQVLINGNGGHDELHIDAKFNGPAKPGTTELFDGNRGAYGMASAWGGAWAKVDGIETVNITADARRSGGSAYGMYTRGNGWGAADGNIIKHDDGSLQATISGYADNAANGHAMHASGGTNIIQGGSRLGDANGDRITLNGHMTAAGYNGKNLVTTGDGDDIVTLNGDMDIKNVANDGMQNKIETGLGNDIVRVSGDMVTNRDNGQNIINVGAGDNLVEINGSMRGVGTNSITLGSGNSTVNLGGGMSASGSKSVNSIQGDASGNTVVNVNGQGNALYAAGGGKNSISGVHDVHADSGGIYSTGSGSSNNITDIAGAVATTTLTANDGARNGITNVGSLNVQAVGNAVAGITAGRNATNNIEANDGIDISAQSTSGGTWGLMAGSLGGNATNNLKAGADINITATGNGTSASAIDNNSGNTTNVESTGGDVTLKATSTTSAARGIWGIGTTTITAGKDLTIEASTQGAAEARGVHTGGTTTLTAQNGDMTVRAEGNVASGLYTISTGTTNVSASGLVDIQAHGNSGSNNTYGGNATALYAESQNTGQLARNIIEGREVSIAAQTLQNGGTYALYSNTALNKITSDIKATVTAENLGSGNTWGMYATATNNEPGANEITGHDVTVTSSAANGKAYGMQAASTKGDSANTVTLTGGSADISATSDQGSATAMHATGRGVNTITGNGDVTVSGTAAGGYGIGMSAESSGKNSIITGAGNVTVSGTGSSYGMGMRAQHASNTIETTDGNVDVSDSARGSSPGYGMSASDFGSNTITTGSGSVTVSGSGGGIYAYSSGSNSIETKAGDVSVLGSGGYGMAASSGSNTIITESGNVTVSGPGGSGDGMRANFAGSNSITTESGNVTVSGSRPNSGGGMDASGIGSSNAIATKSGDVTVSGANGMYALASSSNIITTESGDVAVSGLLNGMTAGGSGSSNSITTKDGAVEVSSTSATVVGNYGAGMYVTTSLTASGDSNSIATESGDVKVTSVNAKGSGYGMHGSVYDGNTITTQSGDVTVSGTSTGTGGSGIGMAGHNEIKTHSGDVKVSGTGEYGGYGMYGFGSKITAENGSVEVTGTSAKSSAGMSANSALGGKNEINTQSGDVTVTGTSGNDYNYGMSATGGGSNSITTKSGSITVAGNGASDTASGAAGMDARSSGSNTATNIITTESGAVTVSGNAGASGFGMYANGSGSSNKIDSQSGNVKVVGTSTGTNASNTYGYGAGMYTSRGSNEINTRSGAVEIIGAHADSSASNAPGYGMYASDSGSNTITTGSGAVTVSSSSLSGSSYGMAASASGSNTIESSGDALTVIITATADAASKAIAMWASGGSVNYITGHSQAGGAGDSITLNANNGQGIAMQTLSGGKNIITTGAGDDSVTINGAVKGIGNEINLGGGDNILTISGAVQTGSLNIITADGTYTLILQASSTENFASRYGQWLNDIASDALITSGLISINFDGLDVANLPTDFLTTFNDLLYVLHDNGVSIVPADLYDHLHDPATTTAPMVFTTTDVAEHSGADSIHAVAGDYVQAAHAAGLGTVQEHDTQNAADTLTVDEAGSAAVIGSNGTESSNPDENTGAQGANAADIHPATEHDVMVAVDHPVDRATHDALQSQDALLGTGAHPQLDAHLPENTDSATLPTDSGHEDSLVLDDMLSDSSFYGSENVGLLFHGDSLNQLDGVSASDVTTSHPGEVSADIVLSGGDVSLDSLFDGMSMSRDEYGSMHQDGDGAANMAGMSLTDMHTAITVETPAENANIAHGSNGTDPSMIGEGANTPAWDIVQSSVENSLQETANTAMRQIEAC